MHCEENEILNSSLLSLNNKMRNRLAESITEKNETLKAKKGKTLRKKKVSSQTNSQKYQVSSSSQETENANLSGIGQILFPHNQINTSFTNSFDHNGNRLSTTPGKFIKPSPGRNMNSFNESKNFPCYFYPGYQNYQNAKINPETVSNLNHSNPHKNGRLITQMETPELIKLLSTQFDFFLQILIQNMLLTNDKILLYRCYNILYSFYHVRQKVLTFSKIPEFGIKFDFCKIFNKNKDIILRPQISFFQAPILDIIPILVQFFTKSFSPEEVNVILKEFFPFINPLYTPIKKQNFLGKVLESNESIFNMENKKILPVSQKVDENLIKYEPVAEEIFFTTNEKNSGKFSGNTLNTIPSNSGSPRRSKNGEVQFVGNILKSKQNLNNDDPNPCLKLLNKKRKKFDTIYDNLLMIGLLYHGKKNIELIQQLWVNSRSIQEIRHRIKNLTCKRAPENLIKKWKKYNESPLCKNEFISFVKGLEWFGTKKKWNLISRYFLPERSPDYLEKIWECLCDLKFLIDEHINDTPSPSNCENPLFKFANNSLSFNNVKRKKQIDAKDLSENEKNLLEMSKEFSSDLIFLKEQMKNLNNKNKFFTFENIYEKIEISDCYAEDKKLDQISTRSMNTKIPYSYFNSIPNIISKDSARFFMSNSRTGKLPIFDFHIKKIDDSAYEKIVID